MRPFIKHLIERGCITVSFDKKIIHLADVLTKNSIGAVPIVDKKKELVGIVSERDIVRNLNNPNIDVYNRNISDIMVKSVITAPQTVNSSELMQIMTDNKIRHVVIMDGNILRGIVSIGDVVKRLLEKLEGEAEQLRLFINS